MNDNQPHRYLHGLNLDAGVVLQEPPVPRWCKPGGHWFLHESRQIKSCAAHRHLLVADHKARARKRRRN